MKQRKIRVPEGYEAADYPSFAVTVDNVILTLVGSQLNVLLVKREQDPYAGQWALPGGFKRPDESLDEAAARELREETGVAAPAHIVQLGAYGDPGRDPRTNVVTIAYLAVTSSIAGISAGSDATDAMLWPVDEVVKSFDLAFDHSRILSDAITRAADQVEQTDLALAFVGPTFTLTELRAVYEQLWRTDFDNANFQRAIRGTSREDSHRYVEATGAFADSGPRGGRPPELYRAGPAWSGAPPIRRPRGM